MNGIPRPPPIRTRHLSLSPSPERSPAGGSPPPAWRAGAKVWWTMVDGYEKPGVVVSVARAGGRVRSITIRVEGYGIRRVSPGDGRVAVRL